MALNFPDSPTLNEVYTDSTSGFSYQWNGTVWQSFESSTASNIQELDDISGSFDGVTSTFALTISGQSVTPVTTNQLVISVGGVMQNPTNDFYISGSNIVFTTPPTNGLTFFGTLLGTALSLNTIADGSVTPLKLSTGGPSWNTDGDVVITGIGSTALLVNGNARVTGILTVGTSSITLDGLNNQINVGTGLTLSSTGITAGIITATSFVGDGSGLTGVGIGTDGSVNTTGIITASSFSGDGSGLTGINVGISTLLVNSFSPAIGDTNIATNSNIIITYNVPVSTGVGTITIRSGSATGEILQNIDVLSSSVNINQAVVTITPPGLLRENENIFVNVPSSGFVNDQNVGIAITNYNFNTVLVNRPLFAWGRNLYGELGQNNTTYYSSPVQIPGTTWSSISASNFSSLARKGDNTLWSWGYNGRGQLGQNNTTQYSSPRQIPGNTWSSISGGSYYSLATKTDGTLWSWGKNYRGTLGQNNLTEYSSPVQIPGTTWNNVSAGRDHSLATKTGGTLWAWGHNDRGQLGQNTTTTFGTGISSPVQVPGTTWSSISTGNQHSIATKTDGTLWTWGQNNRGQLGQNNTTNYSSPRQIPGNTWSSISSGNYTSLASKTDGTLWSWGYNGRGQLGQNNTTRYSSPVQIPGNTWGLFSHSLQQEVVALKTDGTLWSWGYNGRGQLGQNNRIDRSSPVQIPGTTWSSVNSGNSHSLAIQQQEV